MKPPAVPSTPTIAELKGALGPTHDIWNRLVETVAGEFAPLKIVWRPSKIVFGHICLLQSKQRTLLYLIPGESKFTVGVILGERAFALAMKSHLPASIKELFLAARPYAEGRGIRFAITSAKQIGVIRKILVIKTTPK